MKELSGHGRARTSPPLNKDIAGDVTLRGSAGEIAATRLDLPHGFKLRGRIYRATAAGDFELVNGAGEVAELEVKAGRPDQLLEELRAHGPGATRTALARFEEQLAAISASGRKVYVAVSDGLVAEGRALLEAILARHGVPADHLVYMSETQLNAIADTLRQHLDIPTPAPPRHRSTP